DLPVGRRGVGPARGDLARRDRQARRREAMAGPDGRATGGAARGGRAGRLAPVGGNGGGGEGGRPPTPPTRGQPVCDNAGGSRASSCSSYGIRELTALEAAAATPDVPRLSVFCPCSRRSTPIGRRRTRQGDDGRRRA